MPLHLMVLPNMLQQERKAPAVPAHIRVAGSNQICQTSCQITLQASLQGKICISGGITACHVVLPRAAALELLVSGHNWSQARGL